MLSSIKRPYCETILNLTRYKVFYVNSAATVLVAARICPPLRGTTTEESIIVSWLKCFEIVKRHSFLSKSARRCIAALEFLDQNIITGQEQLVQTERQNSNLAEQELPISNNAYVPMENAAEFVQGPIQPYFGDNMYNSSLIESNDIGWLHSVPMDLFQYDDSQSMEARHRSLWIQRKSCAPQNGFNLFRNNRRQPKGEAR